MGKLVEIRKGRLPVGNGETGKPIALEAHVELAGLTDGGRLRHPVVPGAPGARVRQAGPQQGELRPGLEPVLGVRQAQLAGLVQRGAVPDGDQHVLEPMARRLGVVDLVGDDRGQARFVGEGGQLRDEPVVVGEQVVGQLHAEVPVGKVARPPVRGHPGHGPLPGQQAARDLPVPTAAQADEMAPGLVQRGLDRRRLEHGECLLAGQVAGGHEPRQRRVAGRVAGQQDQVIPRGRAGVMLARPATAGLLPAERERHSSAAPHRAQLTLITGNGQLHAQDRDHRGEARGAAVIGLGLVSRLPQAHGRVEARVVGDGQCRHPDRGRSRHQVLGMARPVEEREVAVNVELAVGVRRDHRTVQSRTNVLFVQMVVTLQKPLA